MAFLGLICGSLPSACTRAHPPFLIGRKWFLWLLPLLFQFTATARAPAAESKEYQLKAAFLFNFAQFVKWPADSFTSAGEPFYIGVLGDDPFDGALEQTVQGETVDKHKLIVRRSQNLESLEDCQLIFICKSEESHIAEILTKLDSKPILSVSEVVSFAQEGGIINFYIQGGKVRFEINPESAQHKRLKISSQLLTLGKIVIPAGGGN